MVWFCFILVFLFLFVWFGFFLGPHLWDVEVPRLGVESELLLPARATAVPDLSCVCDLHHSSRPRRILDLLSRARD